MWSWEASAPIPEAAWYIRVLNCAEKRTWISYWLWAAEVPSILPKPLPPVRYMMEISGTFIRGNRWKQPFPSARFSPLLPPEVKEVLIL